MIHREFSQLRINNSISLEQVQRTELCLKKTIHQGLWNLDDYNFLFKLPKSIETKILDWFVELLFLIKVDSETKIKILIPGIGSGRNELLFISSLIKKYPKTIIEIDAVDYSEKSIELLNEILLNEGYKIKISDTFNQYSKQNVDIKVYNEDFEEWLDKINYKNQYNFIFAFFILNFLDNWRESLIKTFSLLKENGAFVISQDIGDLCYLDNFFRVDNNWKSNDDLFKFWKQYYKYRSKVGKDTHGFISPSNMSFIERIFQQMNYIFSNDRDTSISFFWDYNTLVHEEQDQDINTLRDFNFWLSLINPVNQDDNIFECLSLDQNSITKIYDKLAESYENKTIKGDLIFGQKLIYFIKPDTSINIDKLFDQYVYDNCFRIDTLLLKKFSNRYYKQKIPLKALLLNRALDVYNLFIHNKAKSMVSLFSKEAKYINGTIQYQWRQEITPILFPRNYSSKKVIRFISYYGLYFCISEYLKNERNTIRLFTELIYSALPEKIGLVFSISQNCEEKVEPIIYSNGKLKALRFCIPKSKVEKLKTHIDNVIIDYDKDSFHSFEENHFSTKVINDYKSEYYNRYKESGEYEKILKFVTKLIDKKTVHDTTKIIEHYLTVDDELKEQLKERFQHLYLALITHFVDSNIIVYTSSNSYFKNAETHKSEDGFFGLIVADNIANIDNPYFIESYYDVLLGYTYIYSGIDSAIEIEKEIINHATKSAKAAIMSRNMSHNLGSHVMFYLKNKLEDVETLIKEDVLRELVQRGIEDDKIEGTLIKEKILEELIRKGIEDGNIKEIFDRLRLHSSEEIARVELPFLIGLGKFISYIQERQDFLATVSTGDVPYSIPQKFKDIIFDELNCDYKALRHDKAESFKAGCKNILLSYIAKSEGLERRNISIEFGEFDGLNNENRYFKPEDIDDEGHIYKLRTNYSSNPKIEINPKAVEDLENLRNIEVGFPGGIIGRQAFFSIIENFIRNSAKHSVIKPGSDLRVILNADTEFDDDLIKITLTNNLKNSNIEVLKTIKEAIEDEYIYDDGSLVESNKGIKEMRISAAWLRNYSGREEDAEPKILSITTDKYGSLMYEFYLQKSWKVAIITDKCIRFEKSEIKKLGWDILTSEEFHIDNRVFRIVAVDKDLNDEISAIRKLQINLNDVPFELDNPEFKANKSIFHTLYVNWYEKIIKTSHFPNKPIPKLYISDNKLAKSQVSQYDKIEILSNKDWVQSYKEEGAIVYKDHLESAKQFGSVLELDNEGRFIESITGANSTSRLIRNEILDKEWYLKMAESAITNILIIDERLWNYYTGSDEKEYTPHTTFKNLHPDNNSLHLKNVSVCNLIQYEPESDKTRFCLVDTFGDIIADFRLNSEEDKLIIEEVTVSEDFHVKINFISMHMSLYDKMRKVLNSISTNDVLLVFESILKKLLKTNCKVEEHVLVHTGKSKPTSKELIERYKYLPFASIEYAVKDSKFSLCETLYSVR